MVPSGWPNTLCWTMPGVYFLHHWSYFWAVEFLYKLTDCGSFKTRASCPILFSLALQNVFECELALPGTDYRCTKPTIYSPGVKPSLSLSHNVPTKWWDKQPGVKHFHFHTMFQLNGEMNNQVWNTFTFTQYNNYFVDTTIFICISISIEITTFIFTSSPFDGGGTHNNLPQC